MFHVRRWCHPPTPSSRRLDGVAPNSSSCQAIERWGYYPTHVPVHVTSFKFGGEGDAQLRETPRLNAVPHGPDASRALIRVAVIAGHRKVTAAPTGGSNRGSFFHVRAQLLRCFSSPSSPSVVQGGSPCPHFGGAIRCLLFCARLVLLDRRRPVRLLFGEEGRSRGPVAAPRWRTCSSL